MNEPGQRGEIHASAQRTNWITVAVISGLVLGVMLLAYFMTRDNSDQDKLISRPVTTANRAEPNPQKLCASSATYDLIKRDLFRRAAQLRGSDQAAFDKLSGFAVVRMDHPVMESQDSSTGAVNCSGSLAIDLPPGVEVVGGRKTLAADVDYTVTMAADGSGPVLLLKNADAIVTPLATLAQTNQPMSRDVQQSAETNDVASVESSPLAQQPSKGVPAPQAAPSTPPRAPTARPSFDCSLARTRGEVAVCNEAALAALDRQMAAQYTRALDGASPEERDILRETARRFYAYRDRCATTACISDAYTGRIREIRDIMEGRWQPAQ